MSQISLDDPKFSSQWGRPLQPAHCPNCDIAHLIPAEMTNALCPACFKAHLEPQPTVIRPELPELLLEYIITPDQIRERFKNWLQGVWLHPKELNPEFLTQRLTRTFIPLWLIDGEVTGTWKAQMGYDYQVVSSQEAYSNKGWTTRKLTETRIRWEPRSGTIDRPYQNISIPALDEYPRLLKGFGKFNMEAVSSYSPIQLERASIRIPSLLPEAAWHLAKSGFNHLAALDCKIASDAQHVDEFSIEAKYENQNWTQLLLPVYTTAYREDNGKVHTILINGQNGRIFGVKRASHRQARNWSLILCVVALVSFGLGLLLAVGTTLLPLLGAISLVFFASALFIAMIAPIPAIWAWNFNKSQDEE